MRDLADDVHRALTVAFTALAELQTGGRVVEAGPVTGLFTGIPLAFFNPVHVWRGDGDLAPALASVVAGADELGVPFQIVAPAGSDHEPVVEQVAAAHAFAPVARPAAGMALTSLHDLPDRPAGLLVEEILHPEAMATVTDLTVESYGLPYDIASLTSGPAVLARRDLHWLVLRRDGEAVATAMVFVTGDIAGVFNVGVPARHRRAGLGAAVTWEAVRVGRHLGARVAVLQASEMGEPVYDRMGFRTVTRLRSFIRESDQ